MIYVLGAQGFVGSAFRRWCEKEGAEYVGIDRQNYANLVGTKCEILINASGNSKKYLAEQDPMADFDMNVCATLQSILDFPTKLYVYLSTIDVYNDSTDPAHNAETTNIAPERLSRYGFAKYMGELCVKRYAPQWLIVRLGGMVGPGLKKNPIYDILHDVPLRTSPYSSYQYLHTDDAVRITTSLVKKGFRGDVFNVCGDGSVPLINVFLMAGKVVQSNDLEREHYEANIERIKSFVRVPQSAEVLASFIRSIEGSNRGLRK